MSGPHSWRVLKLKTERGELDVVLFDVACEDYGRLARQYDRVTAAMRVAGVEVPENPEGPPGASTPTTPAGARPPPRASQRAETVRGSAPRKGQQGLDV